MKKYFFPTVILSLINSVSAYGSDAGFRLGNFYIDIDLIASVAIFMGIFAAIVTATRKRKIFHTEGARIFISLVISMFSVYGLFKLNISYEKIFIDLGIQNFLMSFSLIIIILAIVILWSIWNFRTVIMVFSGAFILMGIIGMASNIIFNWEISLTIGIVLGLIYFWLRKRNKK